MAKLTLKNLFKRYENSGKKKRAVNSFAVNDLSLDCHDGEFIAMLGPSGCGKTTTLRMIAGLEDITGGEVYIGDRLVNSVQPKDRCIGLAFEDYALYPPLSVYDNIAFNLRAKRLPMVEIDQRVREIASLLKVEDLLDMMPVKLSGGQKQRVNMARAIVRRPELLLMDEPLSHLDGKMRQAMRTEIKRLHNEIQCTSVYVTHDQLEAMSLADRIAIMDLGVLQQFGTPIEVYDDPANEFVAAFIGEPPMKNLKTRIIQHFEGSDLRILVPRRYYDKVHDGFDVKVGVRPMDLYIGGQDSKGVPERVAMYENLGDEGRVGVRVGEELLMLILTDERRFCRGDIVRLEVNGEKTHLFDLTTGDRIRAAV